MDEAEEAQELVEAWTLAVWTPARTAAYREAEECLTSRNQPRWTRRLVALLRYLPDRSALASTV